MTYDQIAWKHSSIQSLENVPNHPNIEVKNWVSQYSYWSNLTVSNISVEFNGTFQCIGKFFLFESAVRVLFNLVCKAIWNQF